MKYRTSRKFLLLFSLAATMSHAEPVHVSWENTDLSKSNTSFRDPNLRTVIVSTGPMGIQLVDESSDPASPFPSAALWVQSTVEAPFWFRLNFRPFDDLEVRQGAAEFDLHPVEGRLFLQVGSHTVPWDPASQESYYMQNGAFDVGLQQGEPPTVAGKAVETDSIATIDANTDYRITIKWDFSDGKPIFRIFINGEPVRLQGSAEPFSPNVSAQVSESGINAFRVTIGSPQDHIGKVFVGPMAAATGFVPNLDQSDEPIFKP